MTFGYPARLPPAVVTLTDASTVAIDLSLGNVFKLLLTAGVGATRILGAPTNPPFDRFAWTLEIQQPASGTAKKVTYNAAFIYGADITNVALSTTLNVVDVYGLVYISSSGKHRVMSHLRRYAS